MMWRCEDAELVQQGEVIRCRIPALLESNEFAFFPLLRRREKGLSQTRLV